MTCWKPKALIIEVRSYFRGQSFVSDSYISLYSIHYADFKKVSLVVFLKLEVIEVRGQGWGQTFYYGIIPI